MKGQVAVVGIGNVLLADDGLGVEVIKEMERLALPDYVRLYDGGVGGFSLLGLIDGHREVIFVDALEMGLAPGNIKRYSLEGLKALTPQLRYSLHEVSLQECLPLLKLLDHPPQVVVIGVQPKEIEPRRGLSPEVRASISGVINMILKEIGLEDAQDLNH